MAVPPRPRRPPSQDAIPASGQVSSMASGRYELLAQIATAAQGSLWLARAEGETERGRIVQLRRISVGADTTLGGRLIQAVRLARGVRHPRVAAVLDCVVTETEIAVVMEYVEGEILRSITRRSALGNQPLDVPVVLRLGLDLTRAAIAARSAFREVAASDATLRGAAHGAVSPDAFAVTTYGEPIQLDVGTGGLVLGRPQFADHPDRVAHAAPEALREGAVDDRPDVFALGVVLWELFANRSLFGSPGHSRFVGDGAALGDEAREEAERVKRRVLEMPVPRLDAMVRAGAQVPHDISELISRALERNPNERLSSLDELEYDLERLGAYRASTADDVADAVARLAGASLEARKAALAALYGAPSLDPDLPEAQRPTLPPAPPSAAPGGRATVLSSSPEALSTLEARVPKPPPLPKRRTPGGGQDG